MAGDVGDTGVRDHLQRARNHLLAVCIRLRQKRGLQGERRHYQHVVAGERLVVGGPQLVGEVLGHRVVPTLVAVDRVAAGQQYQLDGLGELAGVGAPPVAVVLHDLGVVEPLPVHAAAVAVHHLGGGTLGGDDVPDLGTVGVPRDGDVLGAQPRTAQDIDGRPYRGIHTRLGVGVWGSRTRSAVPDQR